MLKRLVMLLFIGTCCGIVFKCKSGVCDSDDIKITGNEITILLQDFDDHIEFNDSTISIISRIVVSRPENINTFIMNGVGLTNVHSMAFKQFYNLHTMNLADNLLDHIDEKMFSGLANLRWIFLSYNRLREVHATAFNPLSELEYLNMSHNSIALLDKKVFSNLKKLEAIYLDNNRLCTLPKGIFDRNSVLKFVDLSNNQLKDIHLIFHDSIFMLNAADNQLVHFKLDFKTVDRQNDLAILRLEDNRIRNLTNITTLKITFELNLANNQIVYRPVDMLGTVLFDGFTELWSLNLSNTNFHFSHPYGLVHENPFGMMAELKELDLSYNDIQEIDMRNLRVPDLRSLHLSGNNLTELDVKGMKKMLPNLRGIEISRNNWNCTYLSTLLRQIEKISNLEVNVRTTLQNKNEPNIKGIGCSNVTIATNEVEIDQDERMRLLESKIDELFARLTEALEMQQNFGQILRNLTKNYAYELF